MNAKISKDLSKIINSAIDFAKMKRHRYFTIEHVFYALLEDEKIAQIFYHLNISVQDIKEKLERYFYKHIEVVPNEDFTYEPSQTIPLVTIIDQMFEQVKSSNRQEVSVFDMFIALLYDRNSFTYKLLNSFGIDELAYIKMVSHQKTNTSQDEKEQNDLSDDKSESYEYLKKYCIDLTELAKNEQLDPVIGRDEEIKQTAQVLCRRLKNNPILIGEPGVGKTAVVEGLAQDIVNDKVPEILQGYTIYGLNIGLLVAGTKYRGDFEKRLKHIISELKSIPRAMLFIDEIHTMIGAGSVSGNTIDAANILKPFLARGEIKCIGATTYDEYKTHFEKDKAMSRRFSKVDINEPSLSDTLLILKGLRGRYESFHKVKYSDGVLEHIINLSNEYIKTRFLPDKAIDIMDEVGSHFWVIDQPKTDQKRKRAIKKVSIDNVENIVSKMTKVPKKSISKSDKSSLKTLQKRLKTKIFGQDDAIEKIMPSILISKSGLKRKNRPIATFLFTGPTGVGKTQLAKELASEMGIHFGRFDMSEFMEKHTVSKLIGAPAGYVGFEDGGQLTDMIKKHPHTVLLLDEIEKANEELINILLQVMDSAVLTDNVGNHIDFSHTIIIMTSNITSNNTTQLGFNSDESLPQERNINAFFAKEFINRLSAIIQFDHLSEKHINLVINRALKQLISNIDDKSLEITVSKKVNEHILKTGYSKEFGARHIEHTIDNFIAYELSKVLLFDPSLKNNRRIYIDIIDDKIDITLQPN